eukprot:scaffold43753_cov23-Tisochrysis_lutea.AAC.1
MAWPWLHKGVALFIIAKKHCNSAAQNLYSLIPSLQVHQQILKAQEAVTFEYAPWAAVGVYGWQDSPVAWLGMEHTNTHNMGLGGSQSCYMVLVLPGRDVLVLRGLGAGDAPE